MAFLATGHLFDEVFAAIQFLRCGTERREGQKEKERVARFGHNFMLGLAALE